MKYIQLELQLDEVNTRISELLQEKNSHWTEIAKLAIQVQKQELFKPKFTSFTAWVKDIAEQCDRQPSLIWRYIKASRYYLQLIDAVRGEGEDEAEDEDLDLDRLTEIKAAPEALERLEKVQRQAPTPVFETLRDKVLNGKATVAECREIEKAYRPSMIQNATEAEASYQPTTSEADMATHESLTERSQQNQGQEQEPLVITNRGRPKKGQEGSYGHLGQNKNKNKIVTDDDEAVRSDTGELARNQIAPTIVRSLTVNLVDWTKLTASMKYPAKYYQDHTEVRVNFERQRFRLDFLAVVRWSFKRPKDIFVVEIKSCLQDFESDQKWTNYLSFCHYFCFAIPLSDTDLLNALKQICDKDKRIGILGIDFQAEISEYLTYPVTVIKTAQPQPQKLEAKANKTNLVYETLYERVLGWKDDEREK
ncbi:MAG: MmcB family DNA repair protein [Crocosphaera sp.]|nr:MmcB family DNA repair protein [Crocosphaera sp.]